MYYTLHECLHVVMKGGVVPSVTRKLSLKACTLQFLFALLSGAFGYIRLALSTIFKSFEINTRVFVFEMSYMIVLGLVSSSLVVGCISFGGGGLRAETTKTVLQEHEISKARPSNLRSSIRNPKISPHLKTRRSEVVPLNSTFTVVGTVNNSEKSENKSENSVCDGNGSVIAEEKEWTDEDFELLKKQILKHPVGEPRRWELIAEAFRGRHGVDSVIKTAKSSSEKKPGGGDSFSQFLKQRKTSDKRFEAVNEETPVGSMDDSETKKESGSSNWSSAEDIALLNALKVFPKDVSMRWEKIAAAIPGKSKASCMKRVAELKKDFRSDPLNAW
ncbi:hypothetical protein HHK36_028560 [Tetracentron sinense]|uniref:Uncharacterized protein n=1 Tax=Tetracentron sinense TaxID=13715 RepID=A0A834YBL1_TETSI|nr:hypothetical protein HHK36_028560 [Tetracentron sinense]